MFRLGLTTLILTGLLAITATAQDGLPTAPEAEVAEDAGPAEEPAVDPLEEADKEGVEAEAREAELERETRRSELYAAGDYRIARPGQRPVSNFYAVRGFRTVDPDCYAGALTWETESWLPLGGDARFYVFETVSIRATRSSQRFAQRHRWELYSDPLEIMGTVTTSDGSGDGTARVSLALDMEHGLYRLVTDVAPRVGTYQILSSGGGLSRHAIRDFHFYYADNHYSYVDLSALEGIRGIPAGQSALNDIHALLSNRPPNVHMGYFDWARDEDGVSEGELQIEDQEEIRLGVGMKIQGQRGISLRIFCDTVIRQYEGRWGSD